MTVFFRFIVAIPHPILVGAPGIALGAGGAWGSENDFGWFGSAGSQG